LGGGGDGVEASHRRLGAHGERGGVVGETGAGAHGGRELVRERPHRATVGERTSGDGHQAPSSHRPTRPDVALRGSRGRGHRLVATRTL
jgi:hypothetical protein